MDRRGKTRETRLNSQKLRTLKHGLMDDLLARAM